MQADLKSPLKFKINRVKRLYTGGSGIDRMRGIQNPSDNEFPEDWIASCVEANSRGFYAPGHGLSTVIDENGKEQSFPELLQKYPSELLGEKHAEIFGNAPGVLSKLLDSAIRLPLQVHPDRVFARKSFNSQYGKTEAWIILSTREINGEVPYILLGFNEKLNDKVFREESKSGIYKTGLEMLHKIPVKPGDVYVVYGRMPHAIGPGLTMVEVMEPTDFTINPESFCGDKEIAPEKRFAKLDVEEALDIFDYTPMSLGEVIKKSVPPKEIMEQKNSGTLERIIPRKEVRFFEAQRLSFNGIWNFDLSEKTFRILILSEGQAILRSGKSKITLNAGDSVFLPYSADNSILDGNGKMTIIIPPENKD